MTATAVAAVEWPHWRGFVAHFISPDGRVIDHTSAARSTSEGQAYGLFFALVANDRPVFDRLLAWTRDNLAGGSLATTLPAWHWGRAADGNWRVLDANPASDADLWLAYVLAEAGRLWADRQLLALGRDVARRIAATELARLSGKDWALLPAPFGFDLPGGAGVRLNPSYAPPQLLNRLVSLRWPGAWAAVSRSMTKGLLETSRHGFAADWTVWVRGTGWGVDEQTAALGSYDAIRTYLWLGMLPAATGKRKELWARLSGPLAAWIAGGHVPEKVDASTGKILAPQGPVGFLAALAPMARTALAPEAWARLRAQIDAQRRGQLYGEPATYYDNALALFGLGFVDGRYRFELDGRLMPVWHGTKAAANGRGR